MDKPADPATPFAEVYQAFLDDLATEGRKPTTIARYRYNIVRFETWLVANGRPATLASLEQSTLFAYRRHLETPPQQPRGSHRRRRGGLMSHHTVHSYLRSIKCLASWLKGAGHLPTNPFLAVNSYYKEKGVMPVLKADDRIPKIGKPSDVTKLLAGCEGDRPEDLRDRALVELLYSSGVRAADAANLTIPAIDFERGVLFIENGKGDRDREAFINPAAAEHVRAYIEGGRIQLLERMPRRRGPVPAGASNLLETDVLFLSARGRAGEIGLTASGVLQTTMSEGVPCTDWSGEGMSSGCSMTSRSQMVWVGVPMAARCTSWTVVRGWSTRSHSTGPEARSLSVASFWRSPMRTERPTA